MYDDAPAIDSARAAGHTIDGWAVVSYAQVVQRLRDRYPGRSLVEIEAIVDRECDAFTGGRPLVVPLGVEDGAAEVLGRGSRD
jgi:hypothetical protein